MNAQLSEPSLSAEMLSVMERVLREGGAQPDPTLLPPAEGRALTALTNLRWNVDLPGMAACGERSIKADAVLGSSRCRVCIFVPEGVGQGAILFAHGGGFAFCNPETHERCARVLANESKMPVYVPDYRLAPENPFPAGLMDVVACLRALLQGQISPKPAFVLIVGDSAGANLALAAMLHEKAAGRAGPSGALLFYGTYGNDFATPSYRRFAEGPGLTRAKMQRYWAWYAGETNAGQQPLACPLAASDHALAALPPLYLMAAAVDPLLSDTLILHDRLTALGRADELVVVPGVTHGFLQNTNDLAAARHALAAAAGAARRMCGTA